MLKFIYRILILILVSSFGLRSFCFADVKDDKEFIVVIDAGHGGKDIGATDNGVMEKNINLKVAKQLESLIKKKMKNTKVVMTRETDKYLTLQERADKANKAHGDIFISIHTNSVGKKNKNRKNLSGSSVYTLGLNKDDSNLEVAMRENSVIELEQDFEQKYSGFDPQKDESYIIFEMAQKKNLSQSIHLADNIEKELVKSGRNDRGVHQAGFWVLWATSMPSVLVELDFICNPTSARYLSSDKGSKEMAEAILKGVQKYEAEWNKIAKSSLEPVKYAMNDNTSNNSELSQSYMENSESPLGDTYTEIARQDVVKAKTRQHVEPKIRTNTGVRRRRSEASKNLSNQVSYEKSDIALPVNKNITTVPFSENENNTNFTLASNQQPDKKKEKENKKAEKRRQKEEKKRAEQEAKKRKIDAHNAKVNKLVTVYKIQILASADLLNQGNSRFCGLAPISTYKEDNLYKYYYGESTDKSELEAILADVRKKIPDAFIVKSTKSVQTNK